MREKEKKLGGAGEAMAQGFGVISAARERVLLMTWWKSWVLQFEVMHSLLIELCVQKIFYVTKYPLSFINILINPLIAASVSGLFSQVFVSHESDKLAFLI